MTKRHVLVGVGTAFLMAGMALTPSQVSASDLQTKVIVSNCYVCHGPNGKSAGDIERLNNQTAEKIEESMTKFAAGEKQATIMDRISKGFTPEQIKAIADHIGMMNKQQ